MSDGVGNQEGSELSRAELATQLAHLQAQVQELSEREALYRAIFENAFQFIALLSPDGVLLEANQPALDFAGVTRHEVVGRPFWEAPWWRHSEEHRSRLRQAVAEAAAGRFQRFYVTHMDVGGVLHHVDFSITPILEDDGTVSFLIPEGRYITEEVRARQALAESERRFRAIFDQAFQVAGILTPEGMVVAINRTALRFAGIEESAVLGLPFWETPWWKHSSAAQEQLRYAIRLAGHGQTAKFVATQVDRDGVTHYIDTSIKPLRDDEGKVVALIPEGRDITDRVRVEEALRASEEQYRGLFEAAHDGFAIMTMEGGVRAVNQAMSSLLGYSREELLALDPLAFIHPDDRYHFPRMLAALRQGRSYHTEGRNLRKDGSVFDADVHVSPFAYGGEPHIFISMRDISERRRAEEEKAQLEARLRQSQKMEAIGTLAGGIAHDFNNILTAIMGYTDLASHAVGAAHPAREHLRSVSAAGFRARDLVQQILAFSRQGEQVRKPLLLGPVVKEAIKLLRASLSTTIAIHPRIENQVGAILADATQIHQVVINLCANGADAMEKSGGELVIELVNVREAGRDSVRLSVADSGRGIPADLLERIFDPFFTTKEKGRGTGLGLAMVHGIVQSHEAVIRVESLPGQGSRFDILFPVIRAEVDEALPPDSPPPPKGVEHVLVVDDEAAVLHMEQELLQSLGYTVTATTSSVDALDIFRKDPDRFDLVLTDQTMPLMTGVGLIRELRRMRTELPVILCTGYSAQIDEVGAQELGVRCFLMKPFDIYRLAVMMRQALEQ